MTFSRLLIFLFITIGISVTGFADNIRITGTILEASGFHKPVVAATIKVLNAADSSFVTAASAEECMYEHYVAGEDNQKTFTGGFSVEVPRGGKYIFTVSCVGYKTTTLDVDASKLGKKEYRLQLDPIYLAEVSEILNEVVVKASKVKFYNKGDTLVYNADAFNLAEGSMLDALVQQLPGVELKQDGTIYVNGRYVEELLLNGKHFFDGNKQLMLQNINSYIVKDIEMYDKKGKAGELAGIDLGDSRYVMDVKLKKEYMMGTALNVESGYGSEDRYLGRLFAMAFTPTGQYAAYFNTNNLNDSRKPGQTSTWTPETMPTGVRKTLSGGIDYNVKPIGSRWEFNGNVNAESSRETDGTDVTRTNYLVTGNTYDYQFSRMKNKSVSVGTKHKVQYKTPENYSLSTEPFFNYRKWNNYNENVDATFDDAYNDISTDFIQNIYSGDHNEVLASLINRNLNMDRRKGHSLSAGASLWQGFKIPNTSNVLQVNLSGKYDNRHDERFNHYDINFGQDPVPAQTTNRYFKNYPTFNSKLGAEISYVQMLARGMNLTFSYGYEHIYGKETSDLYQLETLESVEDFMFGKLPSAIDYETAFVPNSSYLSRSTDNNHKFALTYLYSRKKVYIKYVLPIILTNQKLDYLRGDVDTTFSRQSVMFDIGEAMLDWQINDKHNLWWEWSLKSRTPDMVTMVNFTDDTDPLYIRKGNPDLKNSLQFRTRLKFSRNSKKSRFQIEGQYSVLSNALSQGYTYNTGTGIREASYYNLDGNWDVSGKIAYMRRWEMGLMLGNYLGAGHSTNVDLVGEDSPQLSRSKVYNLNFFDEFRLEYRFNKHQLSLNINGVHNRFTSNRINFTPQNTWTVKSGLNAIFELPANFQLATDFTVYNRRGYTDEALNTDNFVWNARLTYKVLKGKLLLMLDGYDILHDLSNVSYTMNAQARTETYRTVLPRYAMFHVQWRFNHTPKGKKK